MSTILPGVVADKVQGAALALLEDTPDVLADDAEAHEVDRPVRDDREDQARPAGHERSIEEDMHEDRIDEVRAENHRQCRRQHIREPQGERTERHRGVDSEAQHLSERVLRYAGYARHAIVVDFRSPEADPPD